MTKKSRFPCSANDCRPMVGRQNSPTPSHDPAQVTGIAKAIPAAPWAPRSGFPSTSPGNARPLFLVEPAFSFENRATLEEVDRRIELQQLSGRSTNLRNSLDSFFAAAEMLFPTIIPGVKQPHHFPRRGITAHQIRSLVKIAVRAGEREVVDSGRAPVLAGNDVLDVKGSVGFILGMQTAILTALPRPRSDELSKRGVHLQAALLEARNASALRRRMERSLAE
jgi:hypothetical protein